MMRVLMASMLVVASGPSADTVTVYVGSYADLKADGIHQFTLDLATGALTKAGGTSGVANPSFLP